MIRLLLGLGVLSVVIIVALTACGGPAQPPSASHPAVDLQVLDDREIAVDSGRFVSLSPDGQWLAVDDAPELCIYAADSMGEEVCVNYKDENVHSLAASTLAWSPDSSRLVFCENATRYMHDSDIWLLEIETGDLRNLTDDDYEGGILEGGRRASGVLLDFAPAWSPDGRKLVFARSELVEGDYDGTALYTVDAKGGEPARLVRVSREEPLVVWYGVYWSVRPERIYYSVLFREPDDPDSGLWVVDGDGRDEKQIVEAEQDEQGPPLLMGVSEGERLALIWYPRAAGMLALEPNVSHYALADLDTGRVEPLKEASGDEIEFLGVRNATLSPDGSKVAYVYRTPEGTLHLAVRDASGGEENVLWETDEQMLGSSADYGLGLDWAQDDTIFAWTGFQSGLMLRVGAK